EDLIFAVIAGFRPAKEQLVALAGVDSLPEAQPFDIHLSGDTWCGPYQPEAFAGDAGLNYTPDYRPLPGSFGCFWDVEKAGPQPPPHASIPFTPETAVRLEFQLLRVHEYGHALFFIRHASSYEDFVKALSFRICGLDYLEPTPVTDPCDPRLA